MSRQPSVVITRQVPGFKALVQHYKKEQDADRVRRLNAECSNSCRKRENSLSGNQ